MTGFNHGMTGAVIALSVKQPTLAVPLAFLSHFASDAIPHYGVSQNEVFKRRFNIILVSDFGFSVFLMIVLAVLFPAHILLIWTCMVAAAIPDLIWWFYRKTLGSWPKGLDKFTVWHLNVNVRSHRNHFYFDTLWFAAMWAIVIFIKLK